MKEQLFSAPSRLLRIVVGLGLAALVLSVPVSASATITLFTMDSKTLSDSGGPLASGTVECDPGHLTSIAGSIIQIAHNELAQHNFGVLVVCDGTVQAWTASLFNSSGVELKPGRAVTNSFAFDFTDFSLGPIINQKIIIRPVH